MRGVLVGSEGERTSAVAEVESLHHLYRALPELWQHRATPKLDPVVVSQAEIATMNTEVKVQAS